MTATILALALAALPPADAGWAGFRGDGTSVTAARPLPESWSATENLAWRKTLPGYGQSSPVVYHEQVFVTAIDGPNKERLLVQAYNLNTGDLVWSKDYPAGRPGKNSPMMSRAAPTPVVDADGLYCLFESGDLVALTHAGAERWKRSLADDYGDFKSNHGYGSSLVQSGRALYVLVDHTGPSYLLALGKSQGEVLWKAERDPKIGWTTPALMRHAGQEQVIISSGGELTAYDAKTGTLTAKLDGLVGNTIPSPTVAGDKVLLGAGENRVKPDLAASTRSNCCVQWTPDGFQRVWQAEGKLISQYASPLVYGSEVYYVSKAGFVHCLDLATGKEHYSERLIDVPWATPVAADGRVYFFGQAGTTTVLKAGPSYEPLALNRVKLAEKPFAPPSGDDKPKDEAKSADRKSFTPTGDIVYGVAAVPRTFVVRTGTELVVIRTPKN